MSEHATEQPAANRAATRYLVAVYSLNPASRPDAHTVACLMLHKGLLSDDGLRAFIQQHIETGIVPELTLSSDEFMQTMNCVTPSTARETRVPALFKQLREYCTRPQATRFQEPLLDGAGYTLGFLSLEPGQWQHTYDVATMLQETMQRDATRVA